jgi:hypothetical protein
MTMDKLHYIKYCYPGQKYDFFSERHYGIEMKLIFNHHKIRAINFKMGAIGAVEATGKNCLEFI